MINRSEGILVSLAYFDDKDTRYLLQFQDMEL